MTPFCATMMTLACLGTEPSLTDGALGLSHSVAGRMGVVYERDSAGRSQAAPMVHLRYTMTLRHQLDSGARIAFSVGIEADNLHPQYRGR
jgi:hypothetical protein